MKALYDPDRPSAYVADFEAYLHDWQGSEEESNLTNWVLYSATGTSDESLFRFVALGYVAAIWQAWSSDLVDVRVGLSENIRRKEEREYVERGIPEELWDLTYGVNVIAVQIINFAAPDDDTLSERLDLLWERFVLPNTAFETPPNEETLGGLRGFFDKGIALHLFLEWWRAKEELGIPTEQRWSDLGLVQLEADRLAGLELPTVIRGCTIDESDTFGYGIRSPGRFGGEHAIAFLAEGDHANVIQIVISGRLGTRTAKLPESSHVDVLRDLGFTEATFPSGQRYRLSSWGGLSGIRKVKD